MPNRLKSYLQKFLQSTVLKSSLKSAQKEQGLNNLADRLRIIVPDITEQYSMFKVDTPYLEIKVRNMHAFQISLVHKAIEEFSSPVIVDIGDSAGTHLKYIIELYGKNKNIKCLSVNMDNRAVEKIRQKGLDAVCARVESLSEQRIDADIFLCFQTLEHVMNPCDLLHKLAANTSAKYLILTVPFLRRSRVGLQYIRQKYKDNVCAENTHIFELSPEDWKLVIRHSGWDIVHEKIYLQYPRRSFLYFTRFVWRRFDFEGFYGAILKKDDTWSSKYMDW